MTPKDCSPLLVKFIKVFISAAQPGLELLLASGTVTAVAELIVDLPAYHCRMAGIMLSHARHDTVRMVMIQRVIGAVFSAIAERHAQAIRAQAKHFWRFAH